MLDSESQRNTDASLLDVWMVQVGQASVIIDAQYLEYVFQTDAAFHVWSVA